MRRKDREISDLDGIIKIIERCEVVRLGLVDNGKPYIVPLNFGYEVKENRIILYFHSARSGRKIDIMKANPHVCFELDGLLQLVRHDIPCEWTAKYESVIGYGHVSFIEETAEKKNALDIIMKRYGFQGKTEYAGQILDRTLIYKLLVEEIVGKSNS